MNARQAPLLLPLVLLATGCAALRRPPPLVVDLDSCVIVIPDTPTRTETFAAGELNRHLQLASGRSLPVQKTSQVRGGRFGLFVGSRPPDTSPTNQLSEWEARYVVTGEGVYLFGDDTIQVRGDSAQEEVLEFTQNRTGTLFAVTAFLERECGFQWVLPGPEGIEFKSFDKLRLDLGKYAWKTQLTRRIVRPQNTLIGAADSVENWSFTPDHDIAATRNSQLMHWLRRQRMGGPVQPRANANWFAGTVSPLPDVGLPTGAEQAACKRLKNILNSGIDGTDLEVPVTAWWTSGLLNYVVARLHVHPDARYSDLEDAYCALFGAAADDVRAYHRHWQEHFEKSVRPRLRELAASGFGSLAGGLYLKAGELFPDSAFAAARTHLFAATQRPLSPTQRTLVQMLFLAGEHQAFLADALRALNAPPRKPEDLRKALENCRRLHRFREQQKNVLVRDLNELALRERRAGDVTGLDLVPLFEDCAPLETLPLIWAAKADPTDAGIDERWPDTPVSELLGPAWKHLRLDRPWNRQSPENEKNRPERYPRIMWAALVHEFVKPEPPEPLYLVAHGVKDICTVYLDGKEIYRHNPVEDKTPRSFRVNLTPALPDAKRDVVLMLRLEQKVGGPAGIWRPLWLAAPPPRNAAEADE
jgi:hypothetical protein